MYCPKCGTQNDDNAFKCIKCETVIQQAPITSVPVKKSNTAVIVLAVIGGVLGLLAVIGILAAIAIPNFMAYRERANYDHFRGGIHLVLEVESKGNPSIDEENIIRIKDILEERVKQFGIKNKIIKRHGERRIIIQLPRCENYKRVVDLISGSYVLEFRLLDEEYNLEQALKGNIPPGSEILYQEKVDQETGRRTKVPYLLMEMAPLTGEDIADARVNYNQYDEPSVSLTFNSKAARLFERITEQNIGKRLAIVLNKEVCSVPVIQDKISGGRAQIVGGFTIEEARDLAIALRAGPYPAPTRVIESRELNREIWLGKS